MTGPAVAVTGPAVAATALPQAATGPALLVPLRPVLTFEQDA
jgi:hypothetical protein